MSRRLLYSGRDESANVPVTSESLFTCLSESATFCHFTTSHMFSKPGVYCAGFQAGSAHFPFVDSRLIDELSSSKRAADGLHRTASQLQFGGREKEGMSWTYIPLLVIDMKSGLSSSVKTSYQVCSPPSEIFFEVALPVLWTSRRTSEQVLSPPSLIADKWWIVRGHCSWLRLPTLCSCSRPNAGSYSLRILLGDTILDTDASTGPRLRNRSAAKSCSWSASMFATS